MTPDMPTEIPVAVPMLPTATPLYAALLAVLLIVLSVRVIRLRIRHRVSLGDGDVGVLRAAIRAQANLAEYAPMGLLLLLLVELGGAGPVAVHLLGGLLLLGRALHALALARKDGRLRVVGMALTFAQIALGAGLAAGLALWPGLF